jgi:uncharacterized protein (DUF3084 family)
MHHSLGIVVLLLLCSHFAMQSCKLDLESARRRLVDGDQTVQRLTVELQSLQTEVATLSTEDDVLASALAAVGKLLSSSSQDDSVAQVRGVAAGALNE